MTLMNKTKICALLKGIETGDTAAISVVNPDKYIQHNPQTHEGGEGLASLFKRLSKTSPKVNIVRVFSDENYVFAHTEYEFSHSNVSFEVFRFEGDHTVEHWDNIQRRKGPNLSNHTMVNGETVVADLDKTDENRTFIREFVESVLINRQWQRLDNFVDAFTYIEHNPYLNDGREALLSALTELENGEPVIQFDTLHRVLSEGNFTLCVCEGRRNGVHTSFYDLYRVDKGKIVEHWDTSEPVPPLSEWKNDNGKF
jgi:predicted SnoaL-like aldol condensation-catalyzing enzyme